MQRQREVPEVVGDARRPGERRPVVRRQPAQRKPVEERAAGEEHDQKHAEHEARDRDSRSARSSVVDASKRDALAHRLGDAERNRDQVRSAGTSTSPRLIDTGSFSLMSSHTPLLCMKLLPRSKRAKLAEHLEVARERRLVEAVELLDLLDLLRVEVAASAAGSAPPSPAGCARISATSCSTGPPGTNWMTMNVTVSDPEQRRDHQQQAFGDVLEHLGDSAPSGRPALAHGVLEPPRRDDPRRATNSRNTRP